MNKNRRDMTVRVFKSHAEADEADRQYYASLSMGEKFELIEILRQQAYATVPAFRDQPRLPRHAWLVVKTQR